MNEIKHCPFCGSEIESGSQFCQNCGASLTAVEETPSTQPVQTTPSASTDSYQQPSVQQVPYQQQPTSVYVSKKQEDTMGVLSVIMGILGCLCVLPAIGSIAAVILGHIARNRSKSVTGLIGLILGYIAVASIVGFIIWWGMVCWW